MSSQSVANRPIRCQSANFLPILCQSANPAPIQCKSAIFCQSGANLPIHCKSAIFLPVPICHSGANRQIQCQSDANWPIRCQSANPMPIRCQSVASCQSGAIPDQSRAANLILVTANPLPILDKQVPIPGQSVTSYVLNHRTSRLYGMVLSLLGGRI